MRGMPTNIFLIHFSKCRCLEILVEGNDFLFFLVHTHLLKIQISMFACLQTLEFGFLGDVPLRPPFFDTTNKGLSRSLFCANKFFSPDLEYFVSKMNLCEGHNFCFNFVCVCVFCLCRMCFAPFSGDQILRSSKNKSSFVCFAEKKRFLSVSKKKTWRPFLISLRTMFFFISDTEKSIPKDPLL